MATDPRLAYEKLRYALEEFHSAALTYQDADAPEVLRRAQKLTDAYIVYDDSLFTHYGIEAPFDTFDDEDEFDEDEFDDDEDVDDDDEDIDDDEDVDDDDFYDDEDEDDEEI
ncbi:DNA primase [Arcanobacterium pinnipediorum]|uniref:DNA primase n=1 Tax=Arcanobacterium pinnipediorum TaxID=1503041 RepID=A0ABY5AGQ9_9ACTO|nr:DNA primase [Arcanobacterium pinnipediorum]USR78676.1 DNA primase [Arcanobacterium pinnipediorum]